MTGIILAGGKSKRMGKPKGLIHLDGTTLIMRTVSIIEPLCSKILISSNTDDYDHLGFEVIKDRVPYGGPMAGIESCLRHSKEDLNVVLSCDMPFVTEKVFLMMKEKYSGERAIIPWHGRDHYEPVCGIYHADMAQILQNYFQKGIDKLPDVFRKEEILSFPAEEIEQAAGKHTFFNINTSEDLKKAHAILKRSVI